MLHNGVKERADGAGDAWAREHREMGQTYNMMDLDAVFGTVFFGQNTGEKLFMEYIPDNYQNRVNKIRHFALVAMFDRKASRNAALCPQNNLSTAVYLWLCRELSEKQPTPPKFFYVIGGQVPPWVMVEVDIFTGELTGHESVIENSQDWHRVWQILGLKKLRAQLRGWVDPYRKPA